MREHKAFVEFKLLDDGPGGFEGYASLFGVLDSGGDVVESGAFKGSLDGFLNDGFISLGHDWDGLAIGTIAEAKEDRKGLYIRTEYHSTTQAQEARRVAAERMARGKSVGLSIGYEIKDGGADRGKDGIRHLRDLGLFEVAQVNVPMLRPAGLTGIKGYVPFEDHSENVRVAVLEWTERVISGSEIRLKEGRALSEARRKRIAAVREALLLGAEEIDGLLKETEPIVREVQEKAPEPPLPLEVDNPLKALHARFLTLDALHQGIE